MCMCVCMYALVFMCMYISMYTHVGYMYMCKYTCTNASVHVEPRDQHQTSFSIIPCISFVEIGSLTEPEAYQLASLAGHQTPGIPLSAPSFMCTVTSAKAHTSTILLLPRRFLSLPKPSIYSSLARILSHGYLLSDLYSWKWVSSGHIASITLLAWFCWWMEKWRH